MRVNLVEGAYEAPSVIASAQRCLNLYAEKNPEDAPAPFTFYPTPGLALTARPPALAPGRCLYRASNGALYAVVGQNVYRISDAFAYTLLGAISSPPNPCFIADNGVDALLVDGTANGYRWDLATNTFAAVVDPDFYGGNRVDYVDLRFVLNKPGTSIFYYSDPTALTFDPLDFAAKAGYPDALTTLIASLRQIWLLGQLTSEVFYNAGALDAIFEQLPGSYMEHGCIAPYSVAKADVAVYWLGQDMQGQRIVYRGVNYQAQRISTHAIEAAIAAYASASDAIGMTYQQNGHLFYVLTFPSADKTWCYDESTGKWHERAWADANGAEHRWRVMNTAFAYGKNLGLDWETGDLYELRLDVFTDNSQPIVRRRGFPHLADNGNRVVYPGFTADMEAGTDANSTPDNPPQVFLRWSDTRGKSWGDAVGQSMGAGGQYLTSVQWRNLGMARDRVFEVFWSTNAKTAIQGAWLIPPVPCES